MVNTPSAKTITAAQTTTAAQVTTANTAVQPLPRATRMPKTLPSAWIVFGGGCFFALCSVGIVMTFGRVSGEEFSPTHFETRQFSFVEIPVIGIQLTPIRRLASSSGFLSRLGNAGLVSRPATPATTWHLLRYQRAGLDPVPGSAEWLFRFLDYTAQDGGGNHYWDDWSQTNPAAARVLWPRVQQLAVSDRYLLIPELFRLVIQAEQERGSVSTAEASSESGSRPRAGRETRRETAKQTGDAFARRLAIELDAFIEAETTALIADFEAAGQAESADRLRDWLNDPANTPGSQTQPPSRLDAGAASAAPPSESAEETDLPTDGTR